LSYGSGQWNFSSLKSSLGAVYVRGPDYLAVGSFQAHDFLKRGLRTFYLLVEVFSVLRMAFMTPSCPGRDVTRACPSSVSIIAPFVITRLLW